jgi:hypothetical protein
MTQTITEQQQVEVPQQLLNIQAEQMTILHCVIKMSFRFEYLRIWPSTFLIEDTGERKKLLHAENICLMPEWMLAEADGRSRYRFTLYFEGLSKACTKFYMLEDIPEPGGFYTEEILRNDTDVYETRVNCKH